MLQKKRRISRKEFPQILAKSKKYNSSHLLLYLSLQNTDDQEKESKFSFSVSKKISKSAVSRNKYRRQGYSIIKKHINNIKPGFFCFFSFKKGSYPINFSNLEKEILELLSKSGMLS